MRYLGYLVFALISLLFVSSTFALPTRVTVRAKAHDAKFIGTSMAAVQVTIEDVADGTLLAKGRIEGGTGDTKRLLQTPHERNQILSTPGAAAFTTTLDITEPTQVKITLDGPRTAGESAVRQSKTLWLIPGHHLDQDGIIFEFYGLTVVTVSPLPNQSVKIGQTVTLSAFVTMMCGCPIETDSLWPAQLFSVEAWLWHDGQLVQQLPLDHAGTSGIFTTSYTPDKTGAYRVIFTAAQDSRGNFGVAYSGFSVK